VLIVHAAYEKLDRFDVFPIWSYARSLGTDEVRTGSVRTIIKVVKGIRTRRLEYLFLFGIRRGAGSCPGRCAQ
jgi:hypothetical protein